MFLVANGQVVEAWQFKLPPPLSKSTASNGNENHPLLDPSAHQLREHAVTSLPTNSELATNLTPQRRGNVRSYLLYLDARLREQTRTERYRVHYGDSDVRKIPRLRMNMESIRNMLDRFAQHSNRWNRVICSRRDEQSLYAREQLQLLVSKTTSKLNANNRHLFGRNWAVVQKKRSRFGVLTRRGSMFPMEFKAVKHKSLKKQDVYVPHLLKEQNRNGDLGAPSTPPSMSPRPAVDVDAQAPQDGGQQLQLPSVPRRANKSRHSPFSPNTPLTIFELSKKSSSAPCFPSVTRSSPRTSTKSASVPKSTPSESDVRQRPATRSSPVRPTFGSSLLYRSTDACTDDPRKTAATLCQTPVRGSAVSDCSGDLKPPDNPAFLDVAVPPPSKEAIMPHATLALRKKLSINSLEDLTLFEIPFRPISKAFQHLGPSGAPLQEAESFSPTRPSRRLTGDDYEPTQECKKSTAERLPRDDVSSGAIDTIRLPFSTNDTDAAIFARLQEQTGFLKAGWGTAFFISPL
eukprot:GEMP01023706.1.p1 GENE.GEMP01023706.1~~GEMP01023706.1.p1  ORF type:complete len:518 (+),score=86.78 GEMP01023706.1:126-1679(+)